MSIMSKHVNSLNNLCKTSMNENLENLSSKFYRTVRLKQKVTKKRERGKNGKQAPVLKKCTKRRDL